MKSADTENLTTKDVRVIVADATKRIDLLLTGVILVLALGFITLLFSLAGFMIDAWQYRAPTYQGLIDQIQSQNTKIDTLNKMLEAQKPSLGKD